MEVADENVNVKGGMNDQYRCLVQNNDQYLSDGFQLGSQGGTRTSARLPRSSAASPSPHALAPRAPAPRAPAPRAPVPHAPAPRAPAPRAPAPRAPAPRAPAPRAPAPRAPRSSRSRSSRSRSSRSRSSRSRSSRSPLLALPLLALPLLAPPLLALPLLVLPLLALPLLALPPLLIALFALFHLALLLHANDFPLLDEDEALVPPHTFILRTLVSDLPPRQNGNVDKSTSALDGNPLLPLMCDRRPRRLFHGSLFAGFAFPIFHAMATGSSRSGHHYWPSGVGLFLGMPAALRFGSFARRFDSTSHLSQANGGRDARTGRHLGAASGVRRYGSRPGDIGGRWGDSDR
ncbi:hypothetical protein BC936DRAFT_141461 [Jimgerdemannia flammicorona]|uniref:Uncharacterized protein n=1 Tax=Jimgerdemannia flammicorona TaxID=994334 RepID=A0A433DMQ6_9FUNG|nr:hypothetical protein BC936DRAFT_141461 [Jimgerdemannia flammicorona]